MGFRVSQSASRSRRAVNASTGSNAPASYTRMSPASTPMANRGNREGGQNVAKQKASSVKV